MLVDAVVPQGKCPNVGRYAYDQDAHYQFAHEKQPLVRLDSGRRIENEQSNDRYERDADGNAANQEESIGLLLVNASLAAIESRDIRYTGRARYGPDVGQQRLRFLLRYLDGTNARLGFGLERGDVNLTDPPIGGLPSRQTSPSRLQSLELWLHVDHWDSGSA